MSIEIRWEKGKTFEDAAYYSWLTPAGDPIGEFSTVAEADSFPLIQESWILVGFDAEGREL